MFICRILLFFIFIQGTCLPFFWSPKQDKLFMLDQFSFIWSEGLLTVDAHILFTGKLYFVPWAFSFFFLEWWIFIKKIDCWEKFSNFKSFFCENPGNIFWKYYLKNYKYFYEFVMNICKILSIIGSLSKFVFQVTGEKIYFLNGLGLNILHFSYCFKGINSQVPVKKTFSLCKFFPNKNRFS